jgi:hypothetical protein
MPTRRHFLAGFVGFTATAVTGGRALLAGEMMTTTKPADRPFHIDRLLGKLSKDPTAPPLADGQWYIAAQDNDGLAFTFPPGTLEDIKFITTDILVDEFPMVVFSLTLQEGEHGPKFNYIFATLGQCQARLRMPTSAFSQNRWMMDREGALLKPMCWGDRVESKRVDRMTFSIIRKVEEPVRFCMTPLRMTVDEPPLLSQPLLPKGVLIDEMGQATLRDWPGKSKSSAEVSDRLKSQLDAIDDAKWPDAFSKWGGDASETAHRATGFFRTEHDGKRWWLIDPDGHHFWSSGIDCVNPDPHSKYDGLETALQWMPPKIGEFADAFTGRRGQQVNFLVTNFIRAFGANRWQGAWGAITVANLKRFGFNTVGNWSNWQFARLSQFPYVRPIEFVAKEAKYVYRDFPDVFDPAIEQDAAVYALQLKDSADDPALIGYFLMNEPQWGFSSETPAAGMLFNTETCFCRDELVKYLRTRYADDAALTKAWQMPATFDQIAKGRWYGGLSDTAKADLQSFSTIMVDRLFTVLTRACKKIDPNHLNLGARYYTVPPDWALLGMKTFDVFSINCYRERVQANDLAHIGQLTNRPTLIGEWHFGALDVGLPASGIGRVKDQAARGQAFRIYVEQAAVLPWCVGVHYFILYDQSALGRFDGENYNIGFLDICNRPYEPLAKAARLSHEALYAVANGKTAPYADAPVYLPKIFC